MASIHHQNAVNCVKGEIHNVLSVMRVNQRWASDARFHREVPLHTESPLMRSFKSLHKDLESCHDLNDFDTVKYLEPFLKVIESERTSGLITGSAVSSLNKFLLYGFVHNEALRAKEAINRIAMAVSNCRFEETHRETDEMVLMKLLELLEYSLRCDAGPLITGANVWRMVQTCYGISRQPRSSMHLCHTAENTLAHLVLTVFSRLEEVDEEVKILEFPTSPPNQIRRVSTLDVSNIRKSYEPITSKETREEVHVSHISSTQSSSTASIQSDASIPSVPHSSSNDLVSNNLAAPSRVEELIPYGLPVLRKILEFLSGLLDPNASNNDENTRILGLSLINIVLETGGTTLASHPSLVSVLQGDLSKFLLQNSETGDLTILSLCLRVVFNLFNSIKDYLKVQLEVFFTSVHMRIIDSPSCSWEQKELAMESLLEFCREPALMLDLYINYDCDVHCTNLFELLCTSLARNALLDSRTNTLSTIGGTGNALTPSSNPSSSSETSPLNKLNILNLLALEGLLAVIDSIARRCRNCKATSDCTTPNSMRSFDLTQLALPSAIPPDTSITDVMTMVMSGSESDSESEPSSLNSSPRHGRSSNPADLVWLQTARERTAEVLQQRKRTKKRLLLCSEKFNTDRKGWIAYAQQLELLPATIDAESVAQFLKTTPGLNKALIGDYLGEGPPDKYPFNKAVREAYVKSFDFCGKRIDEALREFLSKFRLPGEAQKIERLMEIFSQHFYERSPQGPLLNADCAFILSYSIIMLNTDLHNAQVTKKMSVEEFVRNNRGINDGKDLPSAYLMDLYRNIHNNEIQMQADMSDLQSNDASMIHATSKQWDGVLKRSQNVVGASFTSNASIENIRPGIYEHEMFKLIGEKIASSLLFAFESTLEETTLRRTIEGFENMVDVAVFFQMKDLFNSIILSLSKYFLCFASSVLSGDRIVIYSKEERQMKEMRDILMRFSEEDLCLYMYSLRAMESLEFIFTKIQHYGQSVQLNGWKCIMECILSLNELDVLPPSFVEMDDFVDARGVPLPSKTSNSPTHKNSKQKIGGGMSARVREHARRRAEKQAEARASGNSLWNSLSSFLWSEEEILPDLSNVSKVLKASVNQCFLEKEDWNRLCKQLPLDSLKDLINASIEARDPLRSTKQRTSEMDSIDFMLQENAILSFELVSNMILINHARLPTLWSFVHQYIERLIQASNQNHLKMSMLMERTVVNILRISIRLFHRLEYRESLFPSLLLFHTIGEMTLMELSERISCGFLMLIKANAMYLQTQEEWKIVFHLIQRISQYDEGKENGLEILKYLGEKRYLNELNSSFWLHAIQQYMQNFPQYQHKRKSHASIQLSEQYSIQTIRFIQQLSVQLTKNDNDSESSKEESWMQENIDPLWLAIVSIVHGSLNDGRPSVARACWDSLKTILLVPLSCISIPTWEKCFDDILFHLDEKINLNLWEYAEEGRIRSTALLTKSFLHRVQFLSDSPHFPSLWMAILNHMIQDLVKPVKKQQQQMTSSTTVLNQDVLYETTIHALYNLLTIMSAEGLFQKCQEQHEINLFEETWKVLDEKCPHVRQEIGLTLHEISNDETKENSFIQDIEAKQEDEKKIKFNDIVESNDIHSDSIELNSIQNLNPNRIESQNSDQPDVNEHIQDEEQLDKVEEVENDNVIEKMNLENNERQSKIILQDEKNSSPSSSYIEQEEVV